MAAAATLGSSVVHADIIDEVKGGLLAHDVGFLGHHVEGGADFVGEVLFTSPSFLSIIGSPRPTLGGSVNTAGHTDYAYFDMTWTATVWRPMVNEGDGVYLGGFLGGAVHDGNLNVQEDGNKALGTRALYHLGVEAGYHITPVYSVELYFSHLSNADASSHNPGLNNIGVRLGYKF
ncbi:MAG TPA: acyloxyacyl hydrolase [Stellaceae bacterium]|nr:acyloxyacyl hydrolase [Stellaceae bacterium]